VRLTRVSWLFIVLCFVCSVPASAQTAQESVPATSSSNPQAQKPAKTASDDGPFAIKENVEVTGTRSPLESDQSPVSATVVTRAVIESRNLRFLDQALTDVEGVNSYRTRGVQDTDFGVSMRGFCARCAASQSHVLVLLDGQPINNAYTGAVPWATLPISEVDRIEVARGPFSSLYGGNAMGGVINIITRPVVSRSVELSAQYGSQATGSYSARYSDRFFQKLGITVGWDRLQTDGYPNQEILVSASTVAATAEPPVTGIVPYLTPTGGATYSIGQRGDNWYRSTGVRARAEYAFNDRTFASFQYLRQMQDAGWRGYTSTVRNASAQVLDAGTVVFLDNGVNKRATLSPSLYLGGPLGQRSNTYQGQVLRTLSARSQLRFQAGIVDTPLSWYTTPGAAATGSGGPGTYTGQQFRGTYGSVQWSISGLNRHAVTVGTETRADRALTSVAQTTDYTVPGTPASPDTFAGGKAIDQGVYAQDAVQLTSALTVTIGGRYDYWSTYDGTNKPAATSPPVVDPSRSTSAATGKFAAVFRATPTTTVRASVGNAFRNPSVYELYTDLRLSSGTQLLANPNVNPERMTSWETGVRQTLATKATIDAVYFENRVKDLIYRVTDLDADPTGKIRRLTNAGQARTRGVELGLTERPLTALAFRQAYTFNDARITNNPALPATEGKQIPYVPRHVASFSVTATRDRWGATAVGQYESAVFTTDTNTDTVRGVPGSYNAFFNVDLSVSYRIAGKTSLYVNCDNLFGKRYYMYFVNPGRLVFAGIRFRS
jgi:iron complex outermembrane receptor protein